MPQPAHATESRIAKICGRVAQGSLYLLIVILPLVYFPWTVDALELNKQTVALVLVAVSMIAWLGAMVARKKCELRLSWNLVLAAGVLVSVMIAAILSRAPFTSWVGQSLQEYTSFLSTLVFCLLLLVGTHLLASTRAQRLVWSLSLLVSALIGCLTVLAMLGVNLSLSFIGTPNALGLYLVIMSILGAGLFLVAGHNQERNVLPNGWPGIIVRGAIFITAATALIVAMALDFWVLWIGLILGTVVLFTFAFVRAGEFPQVGRFILPMILFVTALLFLFLPGLLSGIFPVEVAPSYRAGFQIARETLNETNWLFGSGPGTYVMDYTQFHQAEINQTDFWDARFDRSGSHLLTLLATTGLVGLVCLLLLVAGLKASALRMLLRERVHDEWKMTFVAFAAWSVSVFGLFFYSANFTLLFLFWLLSAIILSQTAPKAKAWSFSASPRLGLLTAFLFVIINVGLLTALFVSISRYSAEVAFAAAVQADHEGAPVIEVLADLETAAMLNRQSDVFYRNYAHALLLYSAELIQDPNVSPELIADVMNASVAAAAHATSLSPYSVINWSLLGDIYREISPLFTDAAESSLIAYEKATVLAPDNPKYYVSLARTYIVIADGQAVLMASEDEATAAAANQAQAEALELAQQALEYAATLKSDYAPAHYYLALVYERQGDLAGAIERLVSLRSAYPYDVGVGFQLGLLYLRQSKVDLAQAELERIIEIAPNYSNARWYLSAVYEQQGDFDLAIAQVEKIKELNPDNSLVDQRLESLRSGQTAATLPKPLEEAEAGVTMLEEPVFDTE